MGMTITEKIIAKHADKNKVIPNEIVEVTVDWCMLNEVTVPITQDIFYNKFKFDKVFNQERVIFIMDHRVPADSIDTAEGQKITREFGKQLGIKVHEHDGVCHQVMFEEYIVPGELVVAADSHTCSYGCIGVVSAGMGSTDIAATMGTGKTWLKVPETIKIIINGNLRKGVYAKDIILHIIKDISSSGATYKAVEFCGEFVQSLSISERFTLCNMVIEAGGKSAMIEPNEKVRDMYRHKQIDWSLLKADEDAQYLEVRQYDVSELGPQIACPHYVDHVKDLQEVEGIKINQAFLGGCTNGRLEDLAIAADLLKGKKVHKDVRLLIAPASVKIYKICLKLGYIETFIEAGAIINHPGCSTCWGASIGSLASGEVMISSANRNFKGRAGSGSSEIYLASPATVIASSIAGKIMHPAKEMK